MCALLWGFISLALNGLAKVVLLMSVTPVPSAQPHSFSKEGLSFCCSFISPALLHLGLPPDQVHFVFHVSQGALLQKDHHMGEGPILQAMAIKCVLLMFILCLFGP